MSVQSVKDEQLKKLKEFCDNNNNVDFNLLNALLESAKTKKLYKRNNYHQQKISDVIEKTIK